MNAIATAVVFAVLFAPHAASSAKGDKSVAKPKAAGAEQIARGKYMVLTGHCNNCHTNGYTSAASLLARFMAPQLILLWTGAAIIVYSIITYIYRARIY